MNFNRPTRCYDPISVIALTLAGAAGAGAQYFASNAEKKAEKASEAQPFTGALDPMKTTVDPGSSAATEGSLQNNARGRAALIATSPQGVLGTDPTGRKRLLGN